MHVCFQEIEGHRARVEDNNTVLDNNHYPCRTNHYHIENKITMKRIVILGAAESGVGAAALAKKQGFEVFVSDMSVIKDKYKAMLDERQIEWEEGQHSEEKILNADEIIKSPGIPKEAPMVQKAIKKVIHIISEIEFAGRYTHAKMVCITGSNG